MKTVLVVVCAAVALAIPVAFVASGGFNVAADAPHWPATVSILEFARSRSVQRRAADIATPSLDDETRISAGAGNYDAMCAECHLKPGIANTELSLGLYPRPPALTARDDRSAAEAFWVIKHGIKMSGMPAWGKSMSDQHVWNLVAFLRRLPSLSPDQYRALVAASHGHSHVDDKGASDEPLHSSPASSNRGTGHEDHELSQRHGHEHL